MQEMPASLDEALRLAVQKQSVEVAQKQLHRERSQVESTFSLQTVHSGAPVVTPEAANTITGSNNWQLAELTKQVQRLTEELAQLQKANCVLVWMVLLSVSHTDDNFKGYR